MLPTSCVCVLRSQSRRAAGSSTNTATSAAEKSGGAHAGKIAEHPDGRWKQRGKAEDACETVGDDRQGHGTGGQPRRVNAGQAALPVGVVVRHEVGAVVHAQPGEEGGNGRGERRDDRHEKGVYPQTGKHSDRGNAPMRSAAIQRR